MPGQARPARYASIRDAAGLGSGALARAIAAGDPQHPVPLAGAEVSDVGTDDVAKAGASEQQEGHQRCGAVALRAGRLIGRVHEREDLRPPGPAGVCGAARGRAMPAAGLALICPRRASQAYQPDTAASLRAALAGDNPAACSCLAYRATCSPVTPVTGSTPSAWHQVSHDGARLARRCGVIPMSRA